MAEASPHVKLCCSRRQNRAPLCGFSASHARSLLPCAVQCIILRVLFCCVKPSMYKIPVQRLAVVSYYFAASRVKAELG